MKESKDRTEQFMHSTSAAASQAPSSALVPFPCFPVSYGELQILFYSVVKDQTLWATGPA